MGTGFAYWFWLHPDVMRLVYDQNLIPKGILVGQECDAAFDVHLPTGSSLPKKETGLNGWSVKNICCMNRSNWMIHCFAIHPWILLLYFPFSSLPTEPPGLNRHFMEGSEPITLLATNAGRRRSLQVGRLFQSSKLHVLVWWSGHFQKHV